MIPLIQNSRKCKVICSDRKQIGGCLRTGDGVKDCVGRRYYIGLEET